MDLEGAGWITAVVSALAAVVSAVVAGLAWRDAKRSAAAAETSAKAAEDLAEIEQRRRHEELTPILLVDGGCGVRGSDRVHLTVSLDGPSGLDRLDQIAVLVRDDRDRTRVTAGEPNQEQIAATIWGPYRFASAVDGADKLGRSVSAFSLIRGDSRSLEMEPTSAPSWVADSGSWRQQYADQPIRLQITCVRDGELPWRLPVEVPIPQPRFDLDVRKIRGRWELMARNIGSAPAHEVVFRTPPKERMQIRGRSESLLDVNGRISASVFAFDQTMAMWVELTWLDHLGIPRSRRVDLD